MTMAAKRVTRRIADMAEVEREFLTLTASRDTLLPSSSPARFAPYLVLTLYRSAAGAVHDLSPAVLDHLNADEKTSWQFIVGRESVTSPVLMEEMGFDERKAQRVLKALLDTGLLHRVGRGPATRYEVVRP